MDSLYTREHRDLQEAFGTTKLADFLDAHHVHPQLTEDERAFITARDMFFLSSVDPDGNPTVSYKGGAPGFVRIAEDGLLVFPGYDGNGMFLSMGNIAGQGKVGLLFIDFETPNRLRVQGTARVLRDDPMLAHYPEAQYIVRVAVTKAWGNCPRYIHTYRKVEQSRYVPSGTAPAPMPAWKQLGVMQDMLPHAERDEAREAGLIDVETYAERLAGGRA